MARAAHADPCRPWHGSAGAGGALLLAGGQGAPWRGEVAVDLEPGSRLGALVAWRGFDRTHAGLVAGGLIYEAGAARPRLVVDLHADAGADLDLRAPMFGGGVRTVVQIVGALGVALDTGGYIVIDGVAKSRFELSSSTSLVARW